MRVLVTGAEGQLGRDVVHVFNTVSNIVVSGLGRQELDITDFNQCKKVINLIRPDVIIHCAAYTAVDKAESDEDQAYAVNTLGTRNLAVAAESIGSKVCYISTDYVFDGRSDKPYKEYDVVNPINVYGKTKQAGETMVISFSHRYFIVRTSWVFGLHGNNFVKTMLKLAEERDHIKVVDDQKGSPTFTEDLAEFIYELIQTDKYGIYHASNSGSCSWYEFAKTIIEEKKLGTAIIPCATEDFPRPAPRPRFTVMDHLSIRANGFKECGPGKKL
ncbi:dTDP-4-dehydrorhamnose reductase [Paenibacillus sp. P25]|nr:dTDP-4-dehydrorhamnose reductase [Paenibacillus sp. P25]